MPAACAGVLREIGRLAHRAAIAIQHMLGSMKSFVVFGFAGLTLLVMAGAAAAAEPPAGSGDLHPQDATTSVHASGATDDMAVTQQIRQALESDSSLSTSAKHIEIATNSDAVVLRGAVRAQEPDRIESTAQQYAGIRQVINQLTVADAQPVSQVTTRP
jgi:hypothetical protein